MSHHLERIAAIIASDGELFTDGECLGRVWAYLKDTCGVDPDDHRGEYVGDIPCECHKITGAES